MRALEALIRQAEKTPDTDEADEPSGHFRLRCPRRLLRLWRDVVELARRMSGAHLSHAQAAEAIAAEGLSARAPRGERLARAALVHARTGSRPGGTRAAFAPDLDWSAVR